MHGAVVEGLDNNFVLVGDGGVDDVDEAIRRAGEKKMGGGWVEVELGDVVAVYFRVLDLGGGGGADVPDDDGGLVVCELGAGYYGVGFVGAGEGEEGGEVSYFWCQCWLWAS